MAHWIGLVGRPKRLPTCWEVIVANECERGKELIEAEERGC